MIVLQGKELIEQQSKDEDVNCLPTLSVTDIQRQAERDPFVIKHKGAFTGNYVIAVIFRFIFTSNCRYEFIF